MVTLGKKKRIRVFVPSRRFEKKKNSAPTRVDKVEPVARRAVADEALHETPQKRQRGHDGHAVREWGGVARRGVEALGEITKCKVQIK